MVVKWTSLAIQDLKDFREVTKISRPTEYIIKLVQYVDFLKEQPRLGRIYFYTRGFIIRQLIYDKHRIFYYINEDTINILSVVHHRQDIQKKIDYIKRMF